MIDAAIPKADPKRMARFIVEIGEIGRDPRGGWTRPAFGPDERAAHEVFAAWAHEIGMRVWTDAVGNTIAELPGRSDGPAFALGSHLDTVPQGGNFDGVSGVVAALETARIVAEMGGAERPVRAVAFAAEEGARFGAPCIGSSVMTGMYTADSLRELFDRDGRSAAECAEAVGLRPADAAETIWPRNAVAAFVELHIEQGKVLETRGRKVGIVDAIAGSTRVELIFSGQPDHSGATPMNLRADALAGASEFVVAVETHARAHPTTVATVGRLEVEPGSITTIPGTARVWLDVRDIDSERQRELAEQLLDVATRIAGRRGLRVSATLLSDQSPVVLHKPLRERLARAAHNLGVPFCVLPSGAGHDSQHMATIAPTAMLFVPCREGHSHVPTEWASVDDIARGVDVIACALLGAS